ARLVSMNPRHVRFDIEELYSREMPVQLDVQGQPGIGYSVGDAQISPSLVKVEGPRSKVQKISEIRATVSVEGRRDEVKSNVPLMALDSDGHTIDGVTLSTPSVGI